MSLATHESLTYGEYIAICARQVARKLRSEDIGVALLRLFAGALFYVLAVIALDHLLDLSPVTRTLMLVAAVAVGATYSYFGVIRPLVRRINRWYVARLIDRVVPELEDGVTTVFDLEEHADDPNARLARPLVEDRVVRVLLEIPVQQRLGAERLLHAWYLFAAAVIACCIGLLINSIWLQRSVLASLGRVLVPWAEIAYPTRTRIVDVDPGDDPDRSKAVAGSDVTISAMVEGYIPERVVLFWSDDGQRWRQVELNRPENSFDPWWVKLPQVEKSFSYYLVGGDCKTKLYQFTVLPVPVIEAIRVRYEFPEYTGRDPIVSDVPDIDAPQGTRVTVTAKLPGPAARAELILGKDKRQRLTMHRLVGDPTRVSTAFTVEQDDVYRIWFVLESGESNPNPPVYQIRCRPDQMPEVRIDEPGHDIIDPPLPENRHLPIVVQARDDFGLRLVELVIELPRGSKRTETLYDGLAERRTEGTFLFEFDPERYGLKAGDEIRYWAEATDNRRPMPQRSKSGKFRVRIGRRREATELQQQEAERIQRESGQTHDDQQRDGPGQANQPEEQGAADDQQQLAEQGEERTEQRIEDPEQALREIERFLEEQAAAQRETEADDADQRPEQSEAESGHGDERQGDQGRGDRDAEASTTGEDGMAAGDRPSDDAGRSGETRDAARPDKPQQQPGDQQEGEQGDQGQQAGDSDQEGEAGQQSGAAAGANDSQQQRDDARTPGRKPQGEERQEASGAPQNANDRGQQGEEGAGGKGDQQGDRRGQPAGDDRQPQQRQNNAAGDGGQGSKQASGPESSAGETQQGGAEESARELGQPGQGQQATNLPEGLGLSGARKPGQDGEPGGAQQPGTTDQGQAGNNGQTPPPAGQDRGSGRQQTGTPTGQEGTGQERGQAAGGDQTQKDGGAQQRQAAQPEGQGESSPGADGGGQDRMAPSSGGAPGSRSQGGAGGQPAGRSGGSSSQQQSAAGGQGQGASGAGQGQQSGGRGQGGGGQAGDQGGSSGGSKQGAGQGGTGRGAAQRDGVGQPGAAQGGKPGGQGGPRSGQSGGAGTGGQQGSAGGAQPGGAGGTTGNASVGGGAGAAPGGQPQKGFGPDKGQGQFGGGPSRRPGAGGGAGDEGEQEEPERVSQAAKQATELVLTKLEDMLRRDRVDPELLRRLGWTKEDLKRFVKYLKAQQERRKRKAGDVARIGPGRRRLISGPQAVVSDDEGALDVSRTPPPPEYRELIEAYSRSLSGQK